MFTLQQPATERNTVSEQKIIERAHDSWVVTEASGPEQDKCIDDAITTAAVTGSRGSTSSIVGDVAEESSATVVRARFADNLIDGNC
jgi:hypothetical protein